MDEHTRQIMIDKMWKFLDNNGCVSYLQENGLTIDDIKIKLIKAMEE